VTAPALWGSLICLKIGTRLPSAEFVHLLYGMGLVKAQDFFRIGKFRDSTRPMGCLFARIEGPDIDSAL
jgi:hypothetical protein